MGRRRKVDLVHQQRASTAPGTRTVRTRGFCVHDGHPGPPLAGSGPGGRSPGVGVLVGRSLERDRPLGLEPLRPELLEMSRRSLEEAFRVRRAPPGEDGRSSRSSYASGGSSVGGARHLLAGPAGGPRPDGRGCTPAGRCGGPRRGTSQARETAPRTRVQPLGAVVDVGASEEVRTPACVVHPFRYSRGIPFGSRTHLRVRPAGGYHERTVSGSARPSGEQGGDSSSRGSRRRI